MRSFKNIVAVAIFLFSTQLFAQTSPSYYAVLVKAKWCSNCIKNEDRVVSEVLSRLDENVFSVITNDLTNKQTKAASAEILKANNLDYVNLRSTGILFLVDARTKKIVESIVISKSSEDIAKTIERVTTQ